MVWIVFVNRFRFGLIVLVVMGFWLGLKRLRFRFEIGFRGFGFRLVGCRFGFIRVKFKFGFIRCGFKFGIKMLGFGFGFVEVWVKVWDV